jgi:very-short-patch-repair endonuclease
MDPKPRNPDAAAAWIAANQHGVITLTQLKTVGLSDTQVRNRVRKGQLHRIHRGVYAVGHAGLSPHGMWRAAVLAYEPEAWLSHRSAAELWDLLPQEGGLIHVIVRRGVSGRPGIRLHRSPSLPKSDLTIRQGIPVTTPARALRDLKRIVAPAVYRRARRQAEFLKLPLGDTPTDHTRSDPEWDFLRLCRRHHLPAPEVNVRVGRFTVDFLWPAERLVVETDAWATHGGEQGFHDDRGRDLELRALGYRVLRFTDHQVRCDAAAVARGVRSELRAGATGRRAQQ